MPSLSSKSSEGITKLWKFIFFMRKSHILYTKHIADMAMFRHPCIHAYTGIKIVRLHRLCVDCTRHTTLVVIITAYRNVQVKSIFLLIFAFLETNNWREGQTCFVHVIAIIISGHMIYRSNLPSIWIADNRFTTRNKREHEWNNQQQCSGERYVWSKGVLCLCMILVLLIYLHHWREGMGEQTEHFDNSHKTSAEVQDLPKLSLWFRGLGTAYKFIPKGKQTTL